MGYYSDLCGNLFCLPEDVEEIKKAVEELFDQKEENGINPEGKAHIWMSGNGKYYDDLVLPFYQLLAQKGVQGSFIRVGEEYGDSEQITIKQSRVIRFWVDLRMLSDPAVLGNKLAPYLKEPEKASEVVQDVYRQLGMLSEVSIKDPVEA